MELYATIFDQMPIGRSNCGLLMDSDNRSQQSLAQMKTNWAFGLVMAQTRPELKRSPHSPRPILNVGEFVSNLLEEEEEEELVLCWPWRTVVEAESGRGRGVAETSPRNTNNLLIRRKHPAMFENKMNILNPLLLLRRKNLSESPSPLIFWKRSVLFSDFSSFFLHEYC